MTNPTFERWLLLLLFLSSCDWVPPSRSIIEACKDVLKDKELTKQNWMIIDKVSDCLVDCRLGWNEGWATVGEKNECYFRCRSLENPHL